MIHKTGKCSKEAKYIPHTDDRKWDSVGKSCKLACDRQVSMGLVNGTVENANKVLQPLSIRTHERMYSMMCSGWTPFKDAHNFLEWRYRHHNKQADHIVDQVIIHCKSFSYRDTRPIEAITPGNANILAFSDVGFRGSDGFSSAGWLALVFGGPWGAKSLMSTSLSRNTSEWTPTLPPLKLKWWRPKVPSHVSINSRCRGGTWVSLLFLFLFI